MFRYRRPKKSRANNNVEEDTIEEMDEVPVDEQTLSQYLVARRTNRPTGDEWEKVHHKKLAQKKFKTIVNKSIFLERIKKMTNEGAFSGLNESQDFSQTKGVGRYKRELTEQEKEFEIRKLMEIKNDNEKKMQQRMEYLGINDSENAVPVHKPKRRYSLKSVSLHSLSPIPPINTEAEIVDEFKEKEESNRINESYNGDGNEFKELQSVDEKQGVETNDLKNSMIKSDQQNESELKIRDSNGSDDNSSVASMPVPNINDTKEEVNDDTGAINEVSDVIGVINEVNDMSGEINEVSDVTGAINEVSDETGVINEVNEDTGAINEISDVTGAINEVSDVTGAINEVSDVTGSKNKVKVTGKLTKGIRKVKKVTRNDSKEKTSHKSRNVIKNKKDSHKIDISEENKSRRSFRNPNTVHPSSKKNILSRSKSHSPRKSTSKSIHKSSNLKKGSLMTVSQPSLRTNGSKHTNTRNKIHPVVKTSTKKSNMIQKQPVIKKPEKINVAGKSPSMLAGKPNR